MPFIVTIETKVSVYDGALRVDLEERTRFAMTNGGTRQTVTVPGAGSTTLTVPSQAAVAVFLLPRAATSLVLRGASGDSGIPLSGAIGLPLALSLGDGPQLELANNGSTATVEVLFYTSSVAAEIISDAFNRADADTLGTTETGGKTWLVESGQTWGIRSNRAAFLSGPGNNLALVDAGWSDVDVTVTFPIIAADSIDGVAFRCDSDSNGNGWFVAGDPGTATWTLYTFTGGVPTDELDTTVTPANGDTLRIRAVGSTVEVFVNGISRGIITSSIYATNTRCGIVQRNGGTPGTRWENFSVTRVT